MDSHIQLIAAALIAATVCGQDTISLTDRISATETTATIRIIKDTDAYISQRKWAWRFCHDKTKLLVTPFWSNGATWTYKNTVECPTLAEAKDEIAKMKLAVTTNQQAAIDELEPILSEAR